VGVWVCLCVRAILSLRRYFLSYLQQKPTDSESVARWRRQHNGCNETSDYCWHWFQELDRCLGRKHGLKGTHTRYLCVLFVV
jgi:hypothetical protein